MSKASPQAVEGEFEGEHYATPREVLAGVVERTTTNERSIVLAIGSREELLAHVDAMSAGEHGKYIELYIADVHEFQQEASAVTFH